ncbi:MAG: hypothetical protein ACTSR8_21890 [Promethearchaeota archaeon]
MTIKENDALKSEEIIFYIDLISNFLKKKTISKGIQNFINEKKRFNKKCTYGIIIFQGKSNPINIYNQLDASNLINILNEAWDTREKKKSYFENGLFELLSYVFGESQKHSKFYRIIVLSDTPSAHSDDYHNALYDLILKAKNFSTSIDIIRIGSEKFYSDEVKLKIITSETNGGVFFCNDAKHFMDIFLSLIKNRQEFNVVKPNVDDEYQILEKDKTFYERLAADLISLDVDDKEICTLCQRELCPICEAYSDEIRKCFNCGASFHNCCAADFSIAHNIGFKYIFRCPQCETLLKIDEEFVEDVYEESQITEDDYEVLELEDEQVDMIDEGSNETGSYIYQSLDEIQSGIASPPKEQVLDEKVIEAEPSESDIKPQQVETPPAPPPAPPEIPPGLRKTKTVKIGGFFGKEITIEDKSSLTSEKASITQKELKHQTQPKVVEPVVKNKISITSLRPPRRGNIKFCKICGSSVTGSITCPNCGASID